MTTRVGGRLTIAGHGFREGHITLDAQAIFRRRRHQPRRPQPAKMRQRGELQPSNDYRT